MGDTWRRAGTRVGRERKGDERKRRIVTGFERCARTLLQLIERLEYQGISPIFVFALCGISPYLTVLCRRYANHRRARCSVVAMAKDRSVDGLSRRPWPKHRKSCSAGLGPMAPQGDSEQRRERRADLGLKMTKTRDLWLLCSPSHAPFPLTGHQYVIRHPVAAPSQHNATQRMQLVWGLIDFGYRAKYSKTFFVC